MSKKWWPIRFFVIYVLSAICNYRNFASFLHATKLSTLGSLSTRVFETRTATRRGHFTRQDSGVSQIFVLIISNVEKILSNVNVVV